LNEATVYAEDLNLKELRLKNGYSQHRLAILLNIHRTTVGRWENGITIPDETVIERLALTYKVSHDYITKAIDLSLKQSAAPSPHVISFRCSDEVYARIKTNANQANMKIGTYVAKTYAGGSVNVITGLDEFNHELKKIGNNLNQLTLLAHNGTITAPDLKIVNSTLNSIYIKLNRLIDD